MAKLTLTDVTSGFASTTAVNANNTLVETALENTLSRDGTAPNAMGADFDLNSHDLLNARTINAEGLLLNGIAVVPSGTISAPATAISATPSTYNSGTTVQAQLTNVGSTTGSSLVGFTQSGTSAVARTLQDKAREFISVKDFGAVGDGVTDDTAAIQAAHVAAANNTLYYPPGTYLTTKAISVYSGTTVEGVFGKSIIKASVTYTGTTNPDGAIFKNVNFLAGSLTDSNISVSNLTFDYTVRASGGQQVGVFMRYVTGVKVLNCQQTSGGDLSAMLFCKDTQVSDNIAYDIKNCAYDHWSSSGYIIVSNNITRSSTVAPNQCIQVTGDDTDPLTSALLGTGACSKIVIEGNIIDVIPSATNSGIILNNLTVVPTVTEAIVANNYIKGVQYGIVMQGNSSSVAITSNVIVDAINTGILAFSSFPADPTTFPNRLVIGNNVLKNCSSLANAIDIRQGKYCVISGNLVNAGGYNNGINLRADSSFCDVYGNQIDAGVLAKILDLGTSNNVSRPDVMQAKYYGNNIFASALPPAVFTDLDISAIVGAYRVLCYARVINATGSTASFVFRTKGDTGVESTIGVIGTGPNICNMQNGEAQYVTFITDSSGIAQWASSVSAGTAQIILYSYQRLM